MYTLPKNEQSLLVLFRSLTAEQKQEIIEKIEELKKSNYGKK